MSIDDADPEHDASDRWIGEVEYLQRRTRRARQGFWFPVLVLGLLILVSTPLYFQPSQAASGGFLPDTRLEARPASVPLPPAHLGMASEKIHGHWYEVPNCVAVHHVVYEPCNSTDRVAAFSFFPVGFAASPRAIALYWLVGLPLAYGLIGFWYRRRARLRGVSTSPIAFVVAGLALLGLLVFGSPGMSQLLHLPLGLREVVGGGDLSMRGLVPLLTIGIGLLVLSYCERSLGLAFFSTAFLALATLVNLYNLENMAYRIGINPGPELSSAVGVFVAGLVLTSGGLAFAIASRRAR